MYCLESSTATGNVTPYFFMKACVSARLSCDMPTKETASGLWSCDIRSKYGNAYWQVGQLTLKNASKNGPRSSNSDKTTGLPAVLVRANSCAFASLGSAID